MIFEDDVRAGAELAEVSRMISPRFGVIKAVNEYRPDPRSIPILNYIVARGDYQRLGGINSFGNGCDFGGRPAKAYISAIGEMTERYSGSLNHHSRYTEPVSHNDLIAQGRPVVEFEHLQLFSGAQYSSRYFRAKALNRDHKINWATARDALTSENILMPAKLSLFNGSMDDYFGGVNTSGLACGQTAAAAAVGGLLEIIERDAIMIAWWAKVSRPRVDFDSVTNPEIRSAVALLRKYCDQLSVVDLTSDAGIPVYMAMMRGKNADRRPALSLGASCQIDPRRALLKALLEAAQVFNSEVWRLDKALAHTFTADFDMCINNFDDIGHYFAQDRNLHHVNFLDSSVECRPLPEAPPVAFGDSEEQLAYLAQKISSLGFRPLIADLTTADIAQLGLHVCRGIIPGFVPINHFHIYRPWGLSRLLEGPRKMGWRNSDLKTKDLNPVTHPFP